MEDKKRDNYVGISLDAVLFFMAIEKIGLKGLKKYAGNWSKNLRGYILLLDDQRKRKKIKGSFDP